MEILNAMQLRSGKKAKDMRSGSITQPLQFVPRQQKTDEWFADNLDWLEWQGLKQLKRISRRLLKNYKLAKGVIDKTDYIVEDDNEMRDVMEVLTKEDATALELKFYPIIPNVINVLSSEFAKRNSRVVYKAVDDLSHNEMLDQKRQMIEENLVAQAQTKMLATMIQQGLDPQDQQAQEMMSEENIKSLPEIEDFFNKSYRSLSEQWASHQHEMDIERFKMDELEERAFKDMLITDREFWHFKMMENDYDIELWNPVLTFYHKSPSARYVSEGNYVGKMDMMTIADVIDKYGYLMTKEQLEDLEALYPVRSTRYLLNGMQNDGSYYDPSKSHSWNTNMPGLNYRKSITTYDNMLYNGSDIVSWILAESEDYLDFGNNNSMLRVVTCYWKSQRKLFHLTKITENGEIITDIVDETYKVTDKPIYNTKYSPNKKSDNLLYGEHLETIWINDVYGGVKIGPNHPTFWGTTNPDHVNPIYLGIEQNKPGRLKFQFKGDNNLYGCKLPVEGCVFSDRNTHSISLVDLMKPYQVGYNLTNNQIADILVDEIGTVVVLDQNALPKHSLGEDWGPNNYAKAYVAMKDFQILPLDTSITNTENSLSFQHYQQLDLEQTNRLMSRVQLSQFFKQQAFEAIGVTPERLGQQIGQTDTAKAIEQAVAGSYAQTEMYFIQHSDYLMPRVHQMRTDLAQYYHSTKPSLRLQYMTSSDEKVNFEMNGTDLMLRDLNIFITTKANHRQVLENMKQLATTNNTAGATIFDLGNIMQSESLSELQHALKSIEKKTEKARQEELAQAEKLRQMEINAMEKEKQIERDYEARENERERRKDILVAEIRAAGYGSMQDINQNQESDYVDAMKEIRASEEFQSTMNANREKNATQTQIERDKLNVERQKISADLAMKEKDLAIARENKNKYDVKEKKKDS